MSQRLEQVYRAVQLLICRDATLHQRLYEAAKEFVAAAGLLKEWPPELISQVEKIEQKLTSKGKLVDTISSLDVSSAGELAEQIVELAIAEKIIQSRRHARRDAGHQPVPHSRTLHHVTTQRI